MVDDEAIFDFYDARVPADITSAAHFDAWWKKARHADPGPADPDPGRPHRRARPNADPDGLPTDLDGRRPRARRWTTCSTRAIPTTG